MTEEDNFVALLEKVTHPKKRAFLDCYPKTLRATKTATAVGINECTHYNWLKNDEGYSKAFNELKKRVDSDRLEEIEYEIHDRALDRTAQQSSILLMFEAKALNPNKYREKTSPNIFAGNIVIRSSIPRPDYKVKTNEGEVNNVIEQGKESNESYKG